MRTRRILIAATFVIAASMSKSRAGLDVDAPVPKSASLELIVVEAPGCDYCALFRRDVLPSYQKSEQAKDMPIRFVDINDEAAEALDLAAPVDVVPTFVVFKNHKEVGRIPGYTGPEYFYHHINYLLTTAP